MKELNEQPMPHGTIPFAKIRDPQTRNTVMQLNENMQSLHHRLRAAAAAVKELQRRIGGTANGVD